MTMLIAPLAMPVATFKLDVTRRVYAIDAMTGERLAYFVRDFTLVG